MYEKILELYGFTPDNNNIWISDNIELWHGYADKAQRDYLFELKLFDNDYYLFDTILTSDMQFDKMCEKVEDMFSQVVERLEEDDIDGKADVIMQILALKEYGHDKTN
jgi:hypothetical protein